MEWVAEPNREARAAMAALAREAVEKLPDRTSAWKYLAESLLEERAYAEAAAVLRTARDRFPASPAVHVLRSRAARMQHDLPSALTASSAALTLAPSDPDAIVERFHTLAAAGAWNEATALSDSVMKCASADPVLEPLTRSLVQAGRVEDALRLLTDAVSRRPCSSRAVYLLGLTLARAGRNDGARSLIDLDRYTHRSALGSPRAFPTEQAFREALIREIEQEPTLAPDPAHTTTREGLQTLPLTPTDGGALQALVEAIRLAVDAYVDGLPSGDEHPFVRHRPDRAGLSVWAVVYPEKGRQAAHIHGRGWLSGVYYVTVPPPGVAATDAGALILGGIAGEETAETPPWGTRAVMPRPGDLMLFPSWLPHATRPTGAKEPRISVSFDVVPAAGNQR